MPEITEEQIAQWKKKHGDVFKITVGGKEAYLHKPDRKTLGYASQYKDNPIRMAEAILQNCWIDGDQEIKTDDELFLGACQKLGALVQIKEAELVKI